MVSFDNWYVGIGGQSNGTRLQFYGGDGASGQTVLAGILRSAGLSSNVSVANHTLGSSAIDGDHYYMNDTRPGAYWWQLASGTPGPALVDAVERMRQDIANLGPGATKVSMVWSIGETDAEMLRRGLSDTARFKDGMVATFRHIEQQLGVDIDFYLIQTGRFQPPAGEDPAHYISKTLAHEAIQQAQAELAAEHADIHLAAVTKHLEMDDSLHYTLDSSEIVGQMVGLYMTGQAGIGNAAANALAGSDADDVIEGNGGNDLVKGEAGDDYLSGGSGIDTIEGGTGDDTVNGGDNSDQLSGGDGEDYILGRSGNDTIDAGTGDDSVKGGSGHDSILGGDGDDRLAGESHNDTIEGGNGRDTIEGGAGNDLLVGGLGSDSLAGGSDNDLLLGGEDKDYLSGYFGNDTLVGGDGADVLFGGDGADTFLFLSTLDSTSSERDRIRDFQVGIDKIDVALLGYDGIKGIGLVGSHELRVTFSATTNRTYVIDDASGFQFFLDGDIRPELTEASFVFV